MRPALPPIVRALFHLLPDDDRDQVTSDMAELYDDRCRATGELRARAWLLFHAARLVWHFRLNARRERAGSAGLPANLALDLRDAFRQMARARAFTATMTLTLALGIGTTVGVYAIVDAALLAPLPYRQADDLVLVGERAGDRDVSVSYPNYLDWRGRARAFASMAAYQVDTGTLLTGGTAVGVKSYRVTSTFFTTLGVAPALGRALGEADAAAGVVVLSHARWMTTFGGDAGVLGRSITLDDEPFVIVGVMPAGFEFYRAADLWVPIEHFVPGSDLERREARAGTAVVARLATGRREDDARSEMRDIARQLAIEHPVENGNVTATIESLRNAQVGGARPGLLALLAAVGALLAIGCLNAASLQTARISSRAQEFAVRAALGAGQRRLARQLIVEGLVLASLAGLAGLAFARLLIGATAALDPGGIPRLAEAAIDGRVLVFALALSAVVGGAFGLLPLLQTRPHALAAGLLDAGRSGVGSRRWARLRAGLVFSQVALSLTLVTGSALMIQTMVRLALVEPGFDPSRVLTVRLQLSTPGTREQGQQRTRAFYHELIARVAQLPGVAAAAVVNPLPLSGSNRQNRYLVEGQPFRTASDLHRVDTAAVSDRYFETMQIPVKRGHAFEASDAGPLSVAVVDETFAARFWPDRDPIGREMQMGVPGPAAPRLRVIGVVGAVRQYEVSEPPRPQIYLSQNQWPLGGTFVVRVDGDPNALAPAVRRLIGEVDAGVPVIAIRPGSDLVRESVAARTFSAFVLTLFAALALGLAGLGLYGLMAYEVSERHREIGVRMALGATAGAVRAEILRRAMAIVLAGSSARTGRIAPACARTDDARLRRHVERPVDLCCSAGRHHRRRPGRQPGAERACQPGRSDRGAQAELV